jgi:hypothetical protein
MRRGSCWHATQWQRQSVTVPVQLQAAFQSDQVGGTPSGGIAKEGELQVSR